LEMKELDAESLSNLPRISHGGFDSN
jgi:hypothetical protein